MVNIPYIAPPDLSPRDYSASLYNAAKGVGDTIYGQRRDRRADFEADRNYALEMEKLERGIGSNEETWFGSPQWFQREDGTMGYGVQSNLGNFKEIPPPAGASWAPPVTNLNTGTSYIPVNTRGGGVAGEPIPIDVSGEASETERGKAVGGAQAALPMIEYQSSKLLGEIDAVINDPNLPSLTGIGGGTLPAWSFTTDPGGMIATQANITQLVSESFLQAYNQLKGAGAITEGEGRAATDAMTVLRTQNMSDAAYAAALQKFRLEVEQMLNVARARARGEIPPLGSGVAAPVSPAAEVIYDDGSGTTVTPGRGY